jgi:chloramphenicol O-acetyltransferase type B
MVSEGIVSVGRGTYGADLIKVHNFRAPDGRWLGARLRIGAYCSIAPCEIFLGGNHHMEWTSQYPFRSIWNLENRDEDGWGKGDITIGNDVWIGNASVLLSGVTIGDGAVIGARAVVSRDVNPYAVVVGNPAREVKRRFDEATVKHLLDLRWWDWPEDKLRASLPMLLAPPCCGSASSVDVLKLGEQP